MTTNTPIQPESATLAVHGLAPERVWANLSPSRLVEHAVRREEGQLSDSGAFAAITSPHTGRSPKDKFVVDEPGSSAEVWWERNEKLSEAHFARLLESARAHLSGLPEVFVQDLFGGADPAFRMISFAVSMISSSASPDPRPTTSSSFTPSFSEAFEVVSSTQPLSLI